MDKSRPLYQILAGEAVDEGLTIDLLEIIAEDQTLITYRPRLNQLTGSVTATILLQQIMYWWTKQGRPFYKFKEPCGHSAYRDGDSWTEELGFSRHEFDTALKKIGVKVTRRCSREKAQKTGLVIYWTDMDRRTWYEINEPLLRRKLLDLYATPASGSSPPSTPAPPSPDAPSVPLKPKSDGTKSENLAIRTAASSRYVKSEPGTTKSKKAASRKATLPRYPSPDSSATKSEDTASPDATSSRYPLPDSSARVTETTKPKNTIQKPPSETTSLPPPDPTSEMAHNPGRGVKEEEVDQQFREAVESLAEALEREGIFRRPARAIAEQAVAAGLTTSEVVYAFLAHLATTGRVELATWRLKQGMLEPPALTDQQRLHLNLEWATRFEGIPVPWSGETWRQPPPEAAQRWGRLSEWFRRRLDHEQYVRYLGQSYARTLAGGVLLVEVPDRDTRAWFLAPAQQRHLQAAIRETEQVEHVLEVQFHVRDEGETPPTVGEGSESPATQLRLLDEAPAAGGVEETTPLPQAVSNGSAMVWDVLWEQVLADLALQMTRPTFDHWLRDTRLVEVEGATYTIATPRATAQEWLTYRLAPLIQRTLRRHVDHQGAELVFVVEADGAR